LRRPLTPFEFGLGGPIGNGRKWMSWIERDDLVRLIAPIMATQRAEQHCWGSPQRIASASGLLAARAVSRLGHAAAKPDRC
jgi:NAD dependent epimerase/dehydratase family enzyme